jgi:hypothetical protein
MKKARSAIKIFSHIKNNKYTKEELIKNRNITSAIFLLDQKVEPLEFFL